MSSRWMTETRPAIRDALTSIIDGVYNDLIAEFQKAEDERNASVQGELRQLRAEVSRLRDIESENQSLKECSLALSSSLQQARKDAKTEPHLDLGNVHTSREKSLEDELARTKAKCAQLKNSLDQASALLRTRKAEIDRWGIYSDSQEVRIKKLERKMQTMIQEASRVSVVNGSGTRYRNLEGDDTDLVKHVPNRPNLTPGSLDVSFDGVVAYANTSSDALQSEHVSPRRVVSEPASGTTQSEPVETVDSVASTQAETEAAEDELPLQLPTTTPVSSPCFIKEEPSSEGPVHIMSRPVNKRKRTTPEPIEPTDRICRIKTEGSDPVVTDEFVYFDPQESLDLDEGQTTLGTPRKHQFLASSRFLGDNSMNSTPIAIAQLPRPGRQMQAALPPISIGSRPTNRDDQSARITTPLQPISTNRQMTKTSDSRQQAKDARWRLAEGISELAGDGHDYIETRAADGTGDFVLAKGQGKLSSLLNTPSLENATPLSSRFLQKIQRIPHSAPQVARLGPLLPFNLGTLANAEATPTKAESVKKRSAGSPSAQKQPRSKEPAARQNANLSGKTSARADDTPVRFKPLASLTRQDFKINPKYNEGQNYAFAEVVRGKADRGSLSGCVDPDCCGKYFRQMAQSELNAMGSSMVNNTENIKLMEEYLGDDAYMLGHMTEDRKEALWLLAKTKELADKYGKHRHRFHRQASPPGFWDTGFPSTQEQLREREEAEKMERALIAERYREAMRKGGKWLFRDE